MLYPVSAAHTSIFRMDSNSTSHLQVTIFFSDIIGFTSMVGEMTPIQVMSLLWEGRCKATWKREFRLPWREAGPLNHHDDQVDSDHLVVNNELSLSTEWNLRD